MSYQGIIMAVVVTVAVGTAIYHYFTGNQREPAHSNGGSWDESNFEDRNYSFAPRTGSNPRPRKSKQKEEECTICLSSEKRRMATLECGHIFHSSCIGTWLKTERTCPNCRRRVINNVL